MSTSIEFEDTVPLNPVDVGTNILISGAESAGLSDVVQKPLCTVDDDRETMAVTSTDGERFLWSYRRVAGRDVETAVVDASGRGGGNDLTDLTGISKAFHGHIELRGSGRSREVRISGLDGQPSGWQQFPA